MSKVILFFRKNAAEEEWDTIEKGMNHKYIKRIPTGNVARPWYYIYAETFLKPFKALTEFFGVKEKRITETYSSENIKKDYGVDKKTWASHILEYFSNKDKWDKLFSSKEKREKNKKPVQQKKVIEKIEQKEKKKIDPKRRIINRSLMRKVWSIFSPDGKQIEQKEKNEKLIASGGNGGGGDDGNNNLHNILQSMRNSLTDMEKEWIEDVKKKCTKKIEITYTSEITGKTYKGQFFEGERTNKSALQEEQNLAAILSSKGHEVYLLEENNTIAGKKVDAIVDGIPVDFKYIKDSKNGIRNGYHDGMKKEHSLGVIFRKPSDLTNEDFSNDINKLEKLSHKGLLSVFIESKDDFINIELSDNLNTNIQTIKNMGWEITPQSTIKIIPQKEELSINEHENRSQAMMGNDNAKKDFIEDDISYNPDDENYAYKDTGYIKGAQKEKVNFWKNKSETSEGTNIEEIDWEELEKNSRFAEQQIIKSNIAHKIDYEALKEKGMNGKTPVSTVNQHKRLSEAVSSVENNKKLSVNRNTTNESIPQTDEKSIQKSWWCYFSINKKTGERHFFIRKSVYDAYYNSKK